MTLAMLWFDRRLATSVTIGAASMTVSAIIVRAPVTMVIMVVHITSIVKETTMVSPVSETRVTLWMSIPQVI